MTTWVRKSGHMSSMEQVTDVGGGFLGHGNAWRWGIPDVPSVRCNSIPLLRTYSQEVLNSGVEVEVRKKDRTALEDERQGWFLEFIVYVGSAQGAEQRRHGSTYSAQRGV